MNAELGVVTSVQEPILGGVCARVIRALMVAHNSVY